MPTLALKCEYTAANRLFCRMLLFQIFLEPSVELNTCLCGSYDLHPIFGVPFNACCRFPITVANYAPMSLFVLLRIVMSLVPRKT